MRRHRRPRQHTRIVRTKHGRKRITVNRGVVGRVKRKWQAGPIIDRTERPKVREELGYVNYMLENPPSDLSKQRYNELRLMRDRLEANPQSRERREKKESAVPLYEREKLSQDQKDVLASIGYKRPRHKKAKYDGLNVYPIFGVDDDKYWEERIKEEKPRIEEWKRNHSPLKKHKCPY